MRKHAFLVFVYFLLFLMIYLVLKLITSMNKKYFFVLNEIEKVPILSIKTNQNDSLLQLQHLPKLEKISYRINLSKQKFAWLTLGIATVKRKKSYLIETLSSLIKNLSSDERRGVLLVVFIAEASNKYLLNLVAFLDTKKS